MDQSSDHFFLGCCLRACKRRCPVDLEPVPIEKVAGEAPNAEPPIAPNPGVAGLPNGIDIPVDPWPKTGVDVPKAGLFSVLLAPNENP